MRKKQQKTQLHITTNLCLKFQAKTPSGYGETSLTRFWLEKERKKEEFY